MAKNRAWSGDGGEEAPLQLAPKKNRDDAEMDITPMIDITFLLLIFFLVAAKMDPSAQVTLPKASYGMSIPEKKSVVLIITPGGENSVVVVGGDGTTFSKDAETQEQEVIDYIENGFNGAKQFKGKEKSEVLVKADPTVKHKEIARITVAISKAAVKVPAINIAVLESIQ